MCLLISVEIPIEHQAMNNFLMTILQFLTLHPLLSAPLAADDASGGTPLHGEAVFSFDGSGMRKLRKNNGPTRYCDGHVSKIVYICLHSFFCCFFMSINVQQSAHDRSIQNAKPWAPCGLGLGGRDGPAEVGRGTAWNLVPNKPPKRVFLLFPPHQAPYNSAADPFTSGEI